MNQLLIASLIAASVAGCATTKDGYVLGVGDYTTTVSKKTGDTIAGAAIGCVAGTVLLGNARGCVALAALGGVAGYLKARSDELAAAKAAAAEIQRTPGTQAIVKTEPVVVAQGTGKEDRKDVFKSLLIQMPAAKYESAEGQAVRVKLERLAKRIAAERGEPVNLLIAGAPGVVQNQRVSYSQNVKVGYAQTQVVPGAVVLRLSVDNSSRVEV